jgi:hypothetical protein
MFISQLVLYFVNYLLVLLNTMCILLARVGVAARCVRGRKWAGRRGRKEKGGRKRAGGKGREEKGCRQDKDAWVDALLNKVEAAPRL